MTKTALLTPRETRILVQAALIAGGPQGATEDELRAVLDWAQQTRIDAASLALALDGEVLVAAGAGGIRLRSATAVERAALLDLSGEE